MVDIHSHILPHIDDGAQSMEDSIKMLETCVEHGVDTIVATPHLYPGSYTAPTSHRDEMLDQVREAVSRRQLPIEVIPGRECFFMPEIFNYESELRKLTINSGQYLLIECPMSEIPKYVRTMIFDIQMEGVTPILAHMERYHDVIEDPNLTHKYIEIGCLIQVNIGSLFGRYGQHIQETAEILLESQMTHIVASDMHSPNSMTLGEGLGVLKKIVGEEEAHLLVDERPRAVVQNRPFSVPDPLVYQKKKSFKNLWGLFQPKPPDRDEW